MRRNGPLLIDVLLDAALFTAKEAAAGFVLGAAVGFAPGVVLVHSGLPRRGVLPAGGELESSAASALRPRCRPSSRR